MPQEGSYHGQESGLGPLTMPCWGQPSHASQSRAQIPGMLLLAVREETMSWGPGVGGLGGQSLGQWEAMSPTRGSVAQGGWALTARQSRMPRPHTILCRCVQILVCGHLAKEGPSGAETPARAPGVQLPRKGRHFFQFSRVPAKALAQGLLPAAKGPASWPPPKVNVFMSLQTGQSCQKGQPRSWHKDTSFCTTFRRKCTHTPH